jgi:hypothetical protein
MIERTVTPASQLTYRGTDYAYARDPEGTAWVGVRGETPGATGGFSGAGRGDGRGDGRGGSRRYTWFPASAENAAELRRRLPWLNPVPHGIKPSFGFGDRLGLATPGHIAAVCTAAAGNAAIAPIFAQQSVRENGRLGRTPQEVLDCAMWAVFACGWQAPWGADADHLKTKADVEPFVRAGYSFFTVDPGEHVDNTSGLPAVKYGQAIELAAGIYHHLVDLFAEAAFDFEVSIDETDLPTTPAEHAYIAAELARRGVRFTSLAPRFTGSFEKGVDYIGSLAELDGELAQHAAVASAAAAEAGQAQAGPYKISLHSGSDKFSVYPLLARHFGSCVHVKTAGTSYLEALRVLASLEPDLFRQVYHLSRARFETDRASYHISARLEQTPDTVEDADLPGLLDNFHVRELLHVTFGSALVQYRRQLREALLRHETAYHTALQAHFRRHLDLLAKK